MARSSPHRGIASIVLCSTMLASTAPSLADDQQDFFKGKRLTIAVGSAAGSGYDLGARVLSRHLARHIPGNPAIIVQNMPGGGGRTVASYLSKRGTPRWYLHSGGPELHRG